MTGTQTPARLLLAAGIVLSISCGTSLEEDADLVLRDGAFYTVSGEGATRGSLAVRGGDIVYLGDDGGAERFVGPDTEVVELGGRAVTPGLIDAHSHLVSLGAALRQVDAVDTTSYDEVIERVVEAVERTEPGEWIFGRGWDQNDWADTAFPTHDALSAAVPDHPVWLRRIDGHAALLNAAAMELLGIDAAIADPSGGRFLRDDSGAPTGVLIDLAMDAVAVGLPDPGASELASRLELAIDHCLERGLTTVTELGVSQDEIDAYDALAARGGLEIRSALFLSNDGELLDAWFERGPRIDESGFLNVRGIKLYADGALGSRGAALVEPYSDDPGNRGLLLTNAEEVESVCARALDTGFQVGVHAIGDRGAQLVLDSLETCFGEPRPEARFRLEHAQVMRLEDIDRLAELGVIASMQPTHATSDMPWAEDRVGPERIEGAYAWRRMLDAGVELALGSDFPVERAAPLLGFYAGVARQDLEGRPEGGWRPQERLTRAEVLHGFTLGAARSLFLDDLVGSIEVGKRADLVVFERDIMEIPIAEVPDVPVDLTLIDGRIVYRRSEASS